jgi:hypothetical protein
MKFRVKISADRDVSGHMILPLAFFSQPFLVLLSHSSVKIAFSSLAISASTFKATASTVFS